jgi:hypothetical protein
VVAFADVILQVDDSDSTQQSMGQVIAKAFNIKFGFHGLFTNTMVKVRNVSRSSSLSLEIMSLLVGF